VLLQQTKNKGEEENRVNTTYAKGVAIGATVMGVVGAALPEIGKAVISYFDPAAGDAFYQATANGTFRASAAAAGALIVGAPFGGHIAENLGQSGSYSEPTAKIPDQTKRGHKNFY